MNIIYPVDGIQNWGDTLRNNFHEIENEMGNVTNSATTIVESTGYGVINGLTTYAQATPNMTVGVLNGTVHMSDGTRLSPIGSGSMIITTSDATNPRIDIIYVNSDATIGYLAGTPLPSPIAPSIPIGTFLLSQISVTANATSITSANITDKRRMKLVTTFKCRITKL